MKKIIIAIVAIVIMISVAYFGLNHASKSAPVATNQEPIKIGVIPYPDNGIFYVAQEKGFFKKYGVNVELVPISGDDSFSALGADKIQLVAPYSPDTMAIVAESGIEAKQIFVTSISDGADGLLTTKDIKKFPDLKGKEVYLTLGYPAHFFFRYLTEINGLAYDDIKLVNFGEGDVGPAFATGRINAGMTWEPWLSKGLERKDGQLLLTSHDVPGAIFSVMAARNDILKDRRTDVKNIMRALLDAGAWWDTNINEGNALTAKHLDLTTEEFSALKKGVRLADLQTNLDKFDEKTPLSVYDEVTKAVEYYLHDGVIKTKFAAESVIDPSLINELR